MNKVYHLTTVAVLSSVSAYAAAIFSTTDTVFGGRSDGTSFLVGAVGTDGGNNNYTDNVWPTAEPPTKLIDGVSQKYLNFAELNTGAIITPLANGGLGTIATSIQLWTANDTEGRDPTAYALYGTNAVITGGGPFALALFTLISSGPLALPAGRNGTGNVALVDANSQTVTFANGQSYTTYLLLFPTVKNEPAVNSLQVAEVQLFGTIVPEPGVFGLIGVAAAGLASRRRRTSI